VVTEHADTLDLGLDAVTGLKVESNGLGCTAATPEIVPVVRMSPAE